MDTYWLLSWETNYLILLEQVQANYMKIIINGKTKTIEHQLSVKQFMDSYSSSLSVAVAINQNFIPRSQYHCTTIEEGDNVEILSPMQGG